MRDRARACRAPSFRSAPAGVDCCPGPLPARGRRHGAQAACGSGRAPGGVRTPRITRERERPPLPGKARPGKRGRGLAARVAAALPHPSLRPGARASEPGPWEGPEERKSRAAEFCASILALCRRNVGDQRSDQLFDRQLAPRRHYLLYCVVGVEFLDFFLKILRGRARVTSTSRLILQNRKCLDFKNDLPRREP